MAGFQVSTGDVERTVEDLQRITTALEQALEDADAAVSRMHSAWAGEAAQAHQAAHDAWAVDADEMSHALAAMRRALSGAHGNYTVAVAANQRMWS